MNTYNQRKEQARQTAIKLQVEISNISLSYAGVIFLTNKLEKLGRRYGLTKEFKENGLI